MSYKEALRKRTSFMTKRYLRKQAKEGYPNLVKARAELARRRAEGKVAAGKLHTLSDIRVARGMTQEQVALVAGYRSQGNINDIEHDHPQSLTVRRLMRYANALGLEVRIYLAQPPGGPFGKRRLDIGTYDDGKDYSEEQSAASALEDAAQ